MLIIGEKERSQGMFHRRPTVGTKCTYENMELSHAKVDVANVGFNISHIKLRIPFVKRTRGRTCKTKE